MLILKIISQEKYNKKFKELKVEGSKKKKKEDGGFAVKRSIICLNENGLSFTSLVLDAYRKDKISSSDVSDYLNTSLKHLVEIEQLISERT